MPGSISIFSSVRLLAFAILFGSVPYSLRAEPGFIFDTGNPPWKGERLELPPGFAPDLGWSGVEHIRFSPGMFEAAAPDFFSYVLVFLLAPGSAVTEASLERELLTYYTGLSKAVMGDKKATDEATTFAISLSVAEKPLPGPESAPDATAWSGALDWVEPFATRKAQQLHLELHVWEHEGSPVVLSCVSPLVPDNSGPWKELRAIRAKFRFDP